MVRWQRCGFRLSFTDIQRDRSVCCDLNYLSLQTHSGEDVSFFKVRYTHRKTGNIMERIFRKGLKMNESISKL